VVEQFATGASQGAKRHLVERSADRDADHTGLGQLGHRGQARSYEHVDGSIDRRNHTADVLDVGQARPARGFEPSETVQERMAKEIARRFPSCPTSC